jgi:hypothetical protein
MSDVGMVEIAAGSSSAFAPMWSAELVDWAEAPILPQVPRTTGAYVEPRWGPIDTDGGFSDPALNYEGPIDAYAKNGLLYIVEHIGQGGRPVPVPGPWHILGADRQGLPPRAFVRLARVNFTTVRCLWYQHITSTMPGAFSTPAWQPDLQQILATDDGSFGIGVGAPYPGPGPMTGQTYLGYFPGVPVDIGLNEYAEEFRSQELGLLDYQHPVLIYEAPLAFSKFDIIALPDGRRLLVSDLRHRFQRMGCTLAYLQMAELWRSDSLIYQVNPAGSASL